MQITDGSCQYTRGFVGAFLVLLETREVPDPTSTWSTSSDIYLTSQKNYQPRHHCVPPPQNTHGKSDRRQSRTLPSDSAAHDEVLPSVHHAGVADLQDCATSPRRRGVVLKHGEAPSAGEASVDERDVTVRVTAHGRQIVVRE